MPRKRLDPELAVLAYFETADLGAARLVLKLARATLARRSGQPETPVAVLLPPPPAPKKRPSRAKPKPPQDVPLPGVVTEVGGVA